MKKLTGRTLVLGFMVGVVPLAHAEVDEITVTAERREANLQEVPISVSAFTVAEIGELQIDTV